MEVSTLPRRHGLHIPRRLLGAMSDEALVEQVRLGNEQAFEVVYDRHHRGLLAFCRHMLGSADEAEDALQQSFVSALGDLRRSHKPIALKPWLYTIARNRCVSILRLRRERPLEAEEEPASASLVDEVERRLELRQLVADLRDLPERQREALVLAEVGDLSHAEIGDVLGCEAVKVRALIFQARSSLIDARRARELPCAEVRERLATLRGGALRRSELRRHLKACPGCAEFREEIRRQRALLALALPVAPSLELKRNLLEAAGIGSSGAAGGAALIAKSGAAKLAIGAAVGSAALGGAAVSERHVLFAPSDPARPVPTVPTPSHSQPRPAHHTGAPHRSAPTSTGSSRHVVPAHPRHPTTPPAARHNAHGFTPAQGQSNGEAARRFAATRGRGHKYGLTGAKPWQAPPAPKPRPPRHGAKAHVSKPPPQARGLGPKALSRGANRPAR